MGAGALCVVGPHIGIGEGGLALRAHEAELEAGAGIGGQPTERRQVGDDRVRPVHQLLVDGADGEPQLPLAVGVREFEVAGRHRDQSRLAGKCCLQVEDFASVGQEHFRAGEVDGFGHNVPFRRRSSLWRMTVYSQTTVRLSRVIFLVCDFYQTTVLFPLKRGLHMGCFRAHIKGSL